MLCRDNPEVEALIMGPEDEDPAYAAECRQLAADLGLNGNLRFTGRVRLDDYLPRIDAIVLTSISEAQPLTVLEAGAAGIPSVVTDVGACRELILGRADEEPRLGPGGAGDAAWPRPRRSRRPWAGWFVTRIGATGAAKRCASGFRATTTSV